MRQVRNISAGLVSFGAWNAASPGKGRKEGGKKGRGERREERRKGRKEEGKKGGNEGRE